MHFVDAKGILSSQNGMNLYRGCTHGCIYCDSRSACYQFTHAFEDIEVKQNGAVAKVDKRSTGAMAPFLCLETEKQTPESLPFMV